MLRLPLDTPSDKAERTVDIIKEILAEHEGREEEFPPRVALAEIENDALTIKMVYWYHPPVYWDFMAASQRINLAIKVAFEAEGLRFAPPTSTTRIVSEQASTMPLESPREDQLPNAGRNS